MDGLKEIQKTIKNFVEESKQAKQQISQIESERSKLAEERNQKKNAKRQEDGLKIIELGKQIAELGNQSQELQNKLDKRYNKVRELTNLAVDNLIREGIRKIRKIDEQIEELEERVETQSQREAKYEAQKQAFYERFGRMPELSENAHKEDEIEDKQCTIYKKRIEEFEEKIENEKEKLGNLVEVKKDFKNKEFKKILKIEKKEITENEEPTLPLVEKIEIEEIEPIEEIQIEEIEPIEEIEVEPFEAIEEIQVEPFEAVEEIQIEPFEEIEEVEPFNQIEETQANETPKIEKATDEIEEIAKAIVEQIVEEQAEMNNKEQKIEENTKEQEIIAFEKEDKKVKTFFEENITLSGIIAKIEEGEIVYKAQTSNGEEIKIYPTKLETGNAFISNKEEREKIKEELINYAIVEYKPFDKKVINKIDPIICEVLNAFAEKYNYDPRNLVYNYAMSFSRNVFIEADIVPITYNFSYINTIQLGKVEKREISKICKNANKNHNIDVIGINSTLSGIKYVLRRLFTVNSIKNLTEGNIKN